jgi:uncharacterized protein YfaS (alpha-2-macroglobulin family)
MVDQSNKPYSVYKDPDATWLTVRATVTNPLSVVGRVTAPNGTVFPMANAAGINGLVSLSLTLGRNSPPGTYTVYINATKISTTSPTRITVTENFADHVPFQGQNPP